MKVLKWIAIAVVGLAIIGALLPDEKKDDSAPSASTAAQDSSSSSESLEDTLAEDTVTPAPTPEPTPEPLNVAAAGPTQTTRDQVTLRGSIGVTGTKVRVDGNPAKVRGRHWSRTVTIRKKGDNRYRIVATKKGHDRDTTTAVITRKLSAAEREAARAAERQAFANAATTIPYNQLEKNPNRYKGKKVVYRGQIFQIQEDGGSTWMLLSVTDEGYGFWSDNIWVNYDGTIRGAEDDVITVYGTITGEESYETQIGGETYVPKMRAKFISE